MRTLSPAHAAYVRRVADFESPVFRMFLRLCPLFASASASASGGGSTRGGNRVEEILFRGGVSRGALVAVLEHYAEALVVSIHE